MWLCSRVHAAPSARVLSDNTIDMGVYVSVSECVWGTCVSVWWACQVSVCGCVRGSNVGDTVGAAWLRIYSHRVGGRQTAVPRSFPC